MPGTGVCTVFVGKYIAVLFVSTGHVLYWRLLNIRNPGCKVVGKKGYNSVDIGHKVTNQSSWSVDANSVYHRVMCLIFREGGKEESLGGGGWGRKTLLAADNPSASIADGRWLALVLPRNNSRISNRF